MGSELRRRVPKLVGQFLSVGVRERIRQRLGLGIWIGERFPERIRQRLGVGFRVCEPEPVVQPIRKPERQRIREWQRERVRERKRLAVSFRVRLRVGVCQRLRVPVAIGERERECERLAVSIYRARRRDRLGRGEPRRGEGGASLGGV